MLAAAVRGVLSLQQDKEGRWYEKVRKRDYEEKDRTMKTIFPFSYNPKKISTTTTITTGVLTVDKWRTFVGARKKEGFTKINNSGLTHSSFSL